MLYLYSKRNNSIYSTEDYVLLSSNVIEAIKLQYKEDINNNFGDIEVDPVTYIPKFEYYMIEIVVDEFNNPRLALETERGVAVRKKDYFEAKEENLKGKIVKFFDNKFYTFENDPIKDYDPETNTFNINISKYRDILVNTIKNCEQEVREHGYYYTFWADDETLFLQPFRVVPDNDYQAIKQVAELPLAQRAIKLFTSSNGKRQTSVGSYKWLKGPVVQNEVLEYISGMITGYSGYIKDAIYGMAKQVETIDDLDKLRYIEHNYIDMILNGISTKLDMLEEVRHAKAKIMATLQANNIKPMNDVLL